MQASLDRVIKFLKTVTPGPILEPQEETNIEHRSIYGNVELQSYKCEASMQASIL